MAHGLGEIHPRVREAMKGLLLRDDFPVYLDPVARSMLSQARASAREARLDTLDVIQDGADLVWFTWTGTRIHKTLYLIINHFCGIRVDDEGLALRFESSTIASVRAVLHRCLSPRPDLIAFASKLAFQPVEKYESHLSATSRARLLVRDRLDLDGAIRLCDLL
jgi:hypothetical protein